MEQEHIRLIHRALSEFGYERIGYDNAIAHTRYCASITHNKKTFKIEILLDLDSPLDFLSLPRVKILELPEGIPTRMPHIEADQSLCYLDKEAVFLDPFTPYESFRLLLEQVNRVLADMASADALAVAKEHAYEFSAYWRGITRIFIASLDEKGVVYAYERAELNNGNKSKEYVFLSEKNAFVQKDAWFKAIPDCDGEIDEAGQAILVESDRHPLIEKGESWPPKTFEDFYKWFRRIDLEKSEYLVSLIQKSFIKKKLFVIFKFKGEHIVGFLLQKTDLGLSPINEQIKRGAKKQLLLKSLFSKRFVEPLIRFVGENASQAFIHSRNNDFTLRDKKIVLIGCGTIGGYLAHSLVQNGAGTGQGILSLYDHDRYSTSNIGRHILGGRYLRQIKSHAMKAFLTDDFFGQNLHIEASERFDYNRINLVAGYDLIIDATGDSQFSTLLSRSWHRFDSRKPPLLHGWIDAAGDVVRVLLDDGKNACYHCLANERLPLYSNGFTPRAIRHSCAGSSYFTFTSASSMSAAALTLNIAVKYLKGDKPLRFNQIKLAEEIRYTKNQNLNPTKGCPCCQI